MWREDRRTEATKNKIKDGHADGGKGHNRDRKRDPAYLEVNKNLIILNARDKIFHFKAPNSSVILLCICF